MYGVSAALARILGLAGAYNALLLGSFALSAFFAARLALRLEGRGYYTLTSGSTGVFCSGGCVFALSGTGLLQLEISAGLAIAF